MITPRLTRDGGVAAHVNCSARALAEHGLTVSVIAARVEPQDTIPGVQVIERRDLMNARASVDQRLGDRVWGSPDVIHLHQVENLDLVDDLRRTSPLVLSAHGYTACTSGVHYFKPGQECDRAHGPGCIPNLARCGHTRYPKTLLAKYRNASRGLAALRRSDLAVSYSTAVDRHLRTNGIRDRAVVPYFPTMPARKGSGHEGRRRVVFAGRMVRSKGVGILIRAARDVDGEFVLCGDGREVEGLRALAGSLGLGDRVRFTGWLDGGDLAAELADASVVVMPSLWPEPFGLVGIEALAAGRPVVASATGGVLDWLQDGVGGLAVPPGDPALLAQALDEMLADTGRQQEMGQAGKRFVEQRFTADRHVERLVEIYSQAQALWEAARR
jgi:glycosyltransferase involved in cell wall biosynthesis